MVVLASILCYFRVIFGETFHGEQVAMPDDCAAVAFGINEITSLCHACLVQKAAVITPRKSLLSCRTAAGISVLITSGTNTKAS